MNIEFRGKKPGYFTNIIHYMIQINNETYLSMWDASLEYYRYDIDSNISKIEVSGNIDPTTDKKLTEELNKLLEQKPE